MTESKTVRNFTNYAPWYNLELKNLKLKKVNSFNKAVITNNIEDWNNYKSIRNKYKHQINSTKNKYVQYKIASNGGDQKGLWRAIKSLVLGDNRNDIHSLVINDVIEKDQSVIVNYLNKFFVDSVMELNRSIVNVPYLSNICPVENNFRFELLTFRNLKDILKRMNRKKDLFGLSAKILLENIDNLGNEILHVVNKSMTEGSFPKTLKKSIVIPVPKVSNPKTAVEYRPINMLPTLEKVIEKEVSKQLTKFVQDNNIIIRQQSGFRKGHSCETALIWIIHEWKKRIDVGDKVLAIFLDFKRAFETIDRGILIQKLEGYGVRGVEKKWFESYLCGRSQQTKIMEFTSQEEHVDIGVPQGSTLGVDLFLLYINEINTVLKWCNIALFADDTLLYIADKNLSDIHNKVQEDLKNLEIWLCMNKLKLNTDKTKFMILNSNENLRLQIGCESLGEVSTIKYLGVIIDKQLNFNEHAGYICNKISKKVGFLSRIRKRLSFDNAVMIFNTIILPHFDYCATILYMCNIDIKKTSSFFSIYTHQRLLCYKC